MSNSNNSSMRTEVTIQSERFKDLEGFFKEIDLVLTKDLDWETGHNMNGFNDILRGGFGVHDYEESLQITWKNSFESQKNLGQSLFQDIVDTIHEHKHITLILD